MAMVHIGTSTSLSQLNGADYDNNDIAYIWLNNYNRKMVLDKSSSKATDTTNHPYYIRTADDDGTWVEDPTANDDFSLSGNSITTGVIRSTNWSASAGSEIDMDAGAIKLGGSSSPVFSVTAAGIVTAQLYNGGSIALDAGADITLTGDDSDPGIIVFSGSSYDVRLGLNASGSIFELTPLTDDVGDLRIGTTAKLGSGNEAFWQKVAFYGVDYINLSIDTDYDGSGDDARVTVGQIGFDSFGVNMYVNVNGTGNTRLWFGHAPNEWVFTPTSSGVFLGQSSNGWSGLYMCESDSDPTAPSEGNSVIWQSDGTGSGDDGDIMMKITAGGTTKTTTLVDFSGI